MCLRQCHRRHYKLSSLIFTVPPVALTEAQVVFLYIIHIAIVSFNRMTSKILIQLGDNYEVYTSSKETEALFVIIFKYGTVKSFAICVRGVKFPKMSQNTCVS